MIEEDQELTANRFATHALDRILPVDGAADRIDPCGLNKWKVGRHSWSMVADGNIMKYQCSQHWKNTIT